MLYLLAEGANAFVIAAGNVQTLRRKAILFIRHRFGGILRMLFSADRPASARASNVDRAFRAPRPVAGRVLLVDDVATSGATARECAHRLAGAGARAVTVWCFARASRSDLRETS